MKNLVKYIQNINALNGLWNSGDAIIVGVSGGPDSMCLLDVLAHIAQKEKLKIIVAHVNYGLRGEDSENDQKLVQKTAKKHGFACEIKKCDENISGNESLWREVRYDFFMQVQKKYHAHAIAVGHTKNDQAETLLLHLFRGSGLMGLVGMQMCSQTGIIRPFLQIDRSDVLAYCKKHAIEYRIDTSNEDNVFTRNKIRNQLMPILKEQFNDQIVDVLARFATTTAADYDYLSGSITPFWVFDADERIISFGAKNFNTNHIAVQRMALRQMIQILSGSYVDIEKGFIDEMRKVIKSTKGKNQKIIGKDLKMLKKGDKVEIACRENF